MTELSHVAMRRIIVFVALFAAPACRCDPGPPGGHQPAKKTGATVAKPPEPPPAKRLASIPGAARGMVLDDQHAYLAVESGEAGGSIVVVEKRGGETKVLAKGEPAPQAIALGGTVTGSELVWLDSAGFARMAKDGSGEIKKTPWKPGGRTDICSAGDAIVLCKDAVVRFERDGTTRTLAAVPGGSCNLVACDATHAYVGGSGKIYRALLKREGGAPEAELFASPADHVHALIVAGRDVYWADKTGVHRTPAGGGASAHVATSTDPVALAADDTYLYIASLDGAISRVPRTGGAASQIATTKAYPQMALRTDKTHVYWTSSDGLWSFPK